MSNVADVKSALTSREQEVFDLLLEGSVPKEIAHALNISYATVLYHQNNLYQKLEIHNINELLVKYKNQRTERPKVDAVKDIGMVFTRWSTIKDEFGSYINYMSNNEYIQNNYFYTHNISGNVSHEIATYAGVFAIPDPSSLNVIRNANRFSFSVLGDGNTYEVKIMSTEAKKDHNYYRKMFYTENNVISDFDFSMDELEPSPFGDGVPFIKNNIEGFLIQVYSTGDFNLKFWNINFF